MESKRLSCIEFYNVDKKPIWFIVLITILIFSSSAAAEPVIFGPILAGSANALLYHLDDSTEAVSDEAMKRASASFIRLGFAAPKMVYMFDKDLKSYYDKSWALMGDCFFYRKHNRRGNGFDIGSRFTYRNFEISDKVLEKKSEVLYKDVKLHLMSWDITFRGMFGFYFFRSLWQLYLIAAPRLLWYHSVLKESTMGGPDRRINLVSIGIIGGGGIELAIVPYLGIFAEYNIGYTPVGTGFHNVEGHQVYVGVTLRAMGYCKPLWL